MQIPCMQKQRVKPKVARFEGNTIKRETFKQGIKVLNMI